MVSILGVEKGGEGHGWPLTQVLSPGDPQTTDKQTDREITSKQTPEDHGIGNVTDLHFIKTKDLCLVR